MSGGACGLDILPPIIFNLFLNDALSQSTGTSINTHCSPSQTTPPNAAMVPQNDLHSAYENVTKAYNAMSNGPNFNLAAKTQLKKAAMDLVAATQTPQETARGFLMSNVVHPCYRIAADSGIFAAVTKGPTPIAASQLAERTGVDERLIGLCLFQETQIKKTNGDSSDHASPYWIWHLR